MLKELPAEEVIKTRAILTSRFPLINAVVLNQQSGTVFLEEQFAGATFFIIHKAAFSFINCPDAIPDVSGLLAFLLTADKIPVYFHVYDAPDALIKHCLSHQGVNIRLRKRIQLQCQKDDWVNKEMPLPPGYRVDQINTLNFDLLEEFKLSLSTRYWSSNEDFLENGFGFILVNEAHKPVSICYTACVANKIAEIDVATLAAFQQKGFAKQVVNAFTAHCFENDITPNWDCFEDNHGSLKTALSIGFKSLYNYPLLSIFNKNKEA